MKEASLRSGYVAFRPRARLLRLIGAELISDEVVAITELVKNAHDADAGSVTVEFRGVATGEGEIVVRDDGCGMDLDTLLRHWMEPAGTTKTAVGRQVTRRRRRVLGEKGVGRFAVDKLARRLELLSRCPGENSEIRAVFDWDDFDSDVRMLSEVKNRWEVRQATVLSTHGTMLRMTGLRSRWTERMFRRLCTRLARLKSPFQELDSFVIRIDSDEFPQYSGELRSDLLERAPYRLEGTFDGDEMVEVRINGARLVRHVWNGAGGLGCGPVRVRLFAFDLEADALARVGPRTEVRAWLREWSGISVYRDGFRIWPYGEPHDDWLRLDQRRVNNPVVRLSNNQIVGFVEISRDGNPELRDQTNREGLIHNVAFEDVRRLLYFFLQILESERQAVRHPVVREAVRARTDSGSPSTLPAMLEELGAQAPAEIARELRRLAERSRDQIQKDEGTRRRLLEGHAELAALGLSMTLVDRSLRPFLIQLEKECGKVSGGLMNGRLPRDLKRSLRGMDMTVRTMRQQLETVVASGNSVSRRRRAIDVVVELRRIRKLLEPLLREMGVEIAIVRSGSRLLRAEIRPENFRHLIWILVSNSLDWLGRVRNPEIRIVCRAREGRCEILFADNGPGIPRERGDRVFEPFFSTKEGGQGMGLTVARSLVSLHGGEIEAVTEGHGAQIRVVLPRKRPRATTS
jgi:signal transduction histidine kinase